MLSFVGEYNCKCDAKWRVVVPASFRKEMLGEQQFVFILRKNIYENCLDVYPLKEWEKMVEGLKSRLNLFDRKHASFFRTFYAGVQEVEMDANGRVLLPKRLLEEVGVGKEMVFSGQDTKIEIWSQEEYEKVKLSGEELASLTGDIFG